MITRKLSLLVVATMLFTGTTAFTSEDPTPDDGEESGYVQGSIQFPTRFTDGEGGWPGLVRRTWLCSADTNGTIGYVADVYPESWGGYFTTYDIADETGSGDLDVFFYSEFGDCGGAAAPVTLAEFQNDGPESGFVPEGATKAVFFTAEGVGMTFTYEDFEPPVLSIGDEDAPDLTVRPGTTVVFTNSGSDYLLLESAGLGIDRAGQGQGIPIGDSFRVTVPTTPDAYAYSANGVTGTITVVEP